MSISIKAFFDVGDSIEDAFEEATQLANRVRCMVEFDFNGVTCWAYPFGNPSFGVSSWKKELASDSKYKFASNRL